MSFIGGVVPCGVCGKRVYGAERADADGQTYHKACMRCAECQCVVKLGSYAALGGKFYCKPHFRQLFARSGNYHGAFEGQADPKSKWLNAMASEVEGQGKELRRVQSHVVSRPPPPSNTTSLLREAEDQFSPTQQARKSLTPDADMNYTKRRSFFERIASGSGTTAKRVFGRSHSKDNHKKQKEEAEEEAREEKGKEKDDAAAKQEQQEQQEQREAREREERERQKKEAEEEAATAAAAAQKAKKEQEERERVEREEREAREKVEQKRREKIEERRREREQAEAEAAAARKLQAEQEAAASSEQERQRLADEQREREAAAAAAAADRERKEREEEEERERRESEAKAKAQREREEREAREAERKRRQQQQEEEAKARREKEEAERKARAEAAAETRRKAAAVAETKEAPPTNDQASSSFSRVRNLTMRFAEQQKTGNGGKDLSIEGLKKEGHFKSIRDRWQFGDFNIPSFKKKE